MPYLAASCASNQPVVLQGIIMVDMFMSYVGAHVGCAGHGDEAGGDAAAIAAGARLAMATAASSGGGAARAAAIGRRGAGGGGDGGHGCLPSR